MRPNYESDDASFPAESYSVRQYPGVAFYVLGWETKPDEDTGRHRDMHHWGCGEKAP